MLVLFDMNMFVSRCIDGILLNRLWVVPDEVFIEKKTEIRR